jgi:hypothetical protein
MQSDVSLQPGRPPANYREVLYWRISEKLSRVVIINLLSLPFLLLWGVLFFWLASTLGRMPSEFGALTGSAAWLVFIFLLLLIVLHELVHGLAMRLYGARPRYGFLWKALAFYATAPGYTFPRRQYLTIALAPLVVLSLLAILLMFLLAGTPWVFFIALFATINAASAIGDVWITGIVLHYPPAAYIGDERDGMRIFLPDPGNPSP